MELFVDRFHIAGSPHPPSRGNLPKIESLRGVPKFLLEREDNLEKGGGGRVATFLFFYNSITFTVFEFEVF